MKKLVFVLGLISLLAITMLISLVFGAVDLDFDIHNIMNSTDNFILYDIRMPRSIMVAVAGAILSVVGILMQTITKNPLSEPFILGISSGASAGAVSAIIFNTLSFLGNYNIIASAFIGSFIALILVVFLNVKSKTPNNLILTGVGVSAFFSSLTTMIVYFSRNEAQVRSAMFWSLGSFSGVNYSEVKVVIVELVILLLVTTLFNKQLDLLLLGENSAKQMGLSVRKFQLFIIGVASIVVAILVAHVGVIGFVGLIVPHIMRKFVGSKHRMLVLSSALFGASFLLVCDTIARMMFRPEELPIGIITGVFGAPIFIYIIMSLNRRNA